jgi:hypothetical protein
MAVCELREAAYHEGGTRRPKSAKIGRVIAMDSLSGSNPFKSHELRLSESKAAK